MLVALAGAGFCLGGAVILDFFKNKFMKGKK